MVRSEGLNLPRKFSETSRAVAWLGQFEVNDQRIAAKLLDSFLLVSRDEFADQLTELVIGRAAEVSGVVGLYAEREIRKYRGTSNRLFREKSGQVRRAEGSGPRPVQPMRTNDPEIGSEGPVAQFVTDLCREHRKKFRSHPGPDQIRRDKVRAFFLLTDLIGSGDRVVSYLDAAWRIASVKSWNSYGLFQFEVVAYSATDRGVQRIGGHPSEARVSIVRPCPTIDSSLSSEEKKRAREVCLRYDPAGRQSTEPLGHGNIGALIAFAHGCPNNVPPMFYSTYRKSWLPLFPKRVTRSAASSFGDARDLTTLSERLEDLRQKTLAQGHAFKVAHADGRLVLLVLAALSRPPRRVDTVARRTRLTISEVEAIVAKLIAWEWIDAQRRLTEQGQRELRKARRKRPPAKRVVQEPPDLYYPTALRAPSSI